MAAEKEYAASQSATFPGALNTLILSRSTGQQRQMLQKLQKHRLQLAH